MYKQKSGTHYLPLRWAVLLACLILLAFGTWLVQQPRQAEAVPGINETINYQARLLSQTGAVVPDGTYNIRFKIYCGGDGVLGTVVDGDCTNGTQEDLLWTETRESGNKVTVKNGFFSVYLGSVTALNGNVNWNEDKLWLTIDIGGTGAPSYDGEMSPFTRFSSTPYSLNSKLLGGMASSEYVQLAKGLQADASTANASIAINKTGATANILDLQRAGNSVLLIDNGGTALLKNSTDSTTALRVQNAAGLTLLGVNTSTTPNLITNPSFEVNTTGWSGLGSGAIARVTTEQYHDDASLELTADASNEGAQFLYTFTAAQSYTLSLYLKAGTSSITDVQIGYTNNGGTVVNCLSGQIVVTTGWTRYTCTFTPSGTMTGSNIFVRRSTGNANKLYIDSVQLQTGAVATAFQLGLVQLNGVVNSPVAFKNQSDSTTALQVQNSAGTSLLSVDTLNTTVKINAGLTIGAQADQTAHNFASGCACLVNSAAGTFGGQAGRDAVTASVVYKGKLFVATRETDGAGVYRYDGGNTWTLVTFAAGEAVTADAANIDAYVMTIWNGRLVIGSQTGSTTGAVYTSTTADTTADSFTLLNATRGTFNQVNAPGVSDMIVWNGSLYIATQNTNLAEIVRYDGGTTFTQVTATDGKSVAETATDKDGFIFAVYNGMLISGSISGSTTAIVAAYQGNGTTWTHLHGTTGGGALGAETAYIDITGLAVYNGSLYVAASKTNLAAVYMYRTTTPVANVPGNFLRVTTTLGELAAADATNIDSIMLRTYNGNLYAGSQTTAAEGTAGLYRYSGAPNADWTLINSTRGTFGAQTSVNAISALQVLNGNLYVGTDDGAANVGSVYSWSETSQNSYVLRFDSGNENYGGISFVGDSQAIENNGRMGTFNFSNAISLSSGAFDYAEDYPTYDYTLEPGDIVAINPTKKEYVKKADDTDKPLGIYSANPGFRLQQTEEKKEGENWVPIALVGRVPVKVSTENGPIAPGDSLTMSSVPGVAMKAIKAGSVIGQAMEAYNGQGIVTVTIFVQTSSFNGVSLDAIPGLDSSEGDETDFSKRTLTYLMANPIAKDGGVGSEILTDRLTAGLEIITPRLVADTVTARSIKVEEDLSIGGSLVAANGFKVSGPSNFLNQSVFGGLAVFRNHVVFEKDLEFLGLPMFNNDTGGFAMIKAGEQKVEVRYRLPRPAKPVVNVNISNGHFLEYSVDGLNEKGFTILLKQPAPSDVEFSWTALQIKDAATQVSSSQPPIP